MNVIVQSKTMVITEAMRSFALRQANKFLRRGRKIVNITVFLELIKKKKNDTHAATAKFLIGIPGKNIVVQERARDVYEAITQAARSSVRQLGKFKEKRVRRGMKLRMLPVSA